MRKAVDIVNNFIKYFWIKICRNKKYSYLCTRLDEISRVKVLVP